jgi:hypothetical protein
MMCPPIRPSAVRAVKRTASRHRNGGKGEKRGEKGRKGEKRRRRGGEEEEEKRGLSPVGSA